LLSKEELGCYHHINPMQAPTTAQLLKDATILHALDQAWIDSQSADPAQRHEEGGWVYCDTVTGAIAVRRALAGSRATLDLDNPPLVVDSVVIATFHTHPNPSAEGWESGPSSADEESAWLLGVPCLIRADDGIHTTGPDSRRGGLAGGPVIRHDSGVPRMSSPTATTQASLIPGDQALTIAQADAVKAYRDLTPYRIQLVLEDDGWHIDYDLKDPRLKGGGPHYVIDASTGTILLKRYEQ
jgi:hypothetical protein